MELPLPIKLRIAAAAAIGIILIGLIAWPIAGVADPFTPLTIPTLKGTISLIAWSFLAAFLSYFICWPYGRQIAPIAVPLGLAIWAVKTANLASLMQTAPAAAQKLQILTSIKWHSFFWLAVIIVGLLAVEFAHFLLNAKPQDTESQISRFSQPKFYLNSAIALGLSIVIARIFLNIVTQNIRIFEAELGSIIAQPHTAQIAFAVIISFGVAAFVAKLLLNASYVLPIIASAITVVIAITGYAKEPILQYMSKSSPAVFFPNPIVSILPLQMVAFAAIGAIWGYWLAVRYRWWRKYQIQ